MRYSRFVLFWLVVAAAGCGSGEPETGSATATATPVEPAPVSVAMVEADEDNMIPSAAIASCAGFTAADAASFLRVAAEVLVNHSENYSPSSSLCSFSKPESSDGVGFYLSASSSVERAVAEMEQGRGVGEIAQVIIDRATDTQSSEAPIQAAQSLGEEAYFMDVNGTLMIRVANVQIQVLPMEVREQMKAVGLMVAQRLRDY